MARHQMRHCRARDIEFQADCESTRPKSGVPPLGRHPAVCPTKPARLTFRRERDVASMTVVEIQPRGAPS
jgi:hypothetical protein